MRAAVLILCLATLASCSFKPARSISVELDGEHLWEYYAAEPMWYTLTWYDGHEVDSRTLGKGQRRTVVEIEQGSTCVFVAYPLDSLRPMGGVYSPGDGDHVSLDYGQGRLAELLLDVVDYNASLVEDLDYGRLKAMLPQDWDDDALYAAFLDGSLGQKTIAGRPSHDVELTGLLSGHYFSEYDEGPSFDFVFGDSLTLSLDVGIHRFYNMAEGFVHVVAVYPEGESSSYSYLMDSW